MAVKSGNLMISLIMATSFAITWLVSKDVKTSVGEGSSGFTNQLQAILPANCRMVFIGDGEFDWIELQAALQAKGWSYVCRTAKNTQLYEEDCPFRLPICASRLTIRSASAGLFTQEGYGPVTVIARWNEVLLTHLSGDQYRIA